MKNRILIINRDQYGYHIDTYKYCEYLKSQFDLTYLGFDFELPKIDREGVNIKYVSRKGNKAIRSFRFLKEVNNEIKKGQYNLIFIVFFPAASFVRLLNYDKVFIVDIRSCSIGFSKFKNYLNDLLLRLEISTFDHITVISNSLASALKIKKFHLLPLGGESFSDDIKSYDKINLLYVGTLHGRRIIECVKGLNEYIKRKSKEESLDISFVIIGNSFGDEEKELAEYINQNDLAKYVKLQGYIQNDFLKKFFEDANVGVSYIPIMECFKNQPPTKTYEYLLSGLPVIATKTNEHTKIVNEKCGVLIDDKIEDFVNGLNHIVKMRSSFNSKEIKGLYKENLWENIVLHNLKPYLLEKIVKDPL